MNLTLTLVLTLICDPLSPFVQGRCGQQHRGLFTQHDTFIQGHHCLSPKKDLNGKSAYKQLSAHGFKDAEELMASQVSALPLLITSQVNALPLLITSQVSALPLLITPSQRILMQNSNRASPPPHQNGTACA